MKVAVLHTLPNGGHMETLTPLIAYLVGKDPDIVEWTLFCDTKDHGTLQWIDWWKQCGVRTLDVRHYTHVMTDAPEQDFDFFLADTDDEGLIACLNDRSRLFVLDHAPIDRSKASHRIAIRRFEPHDASITAITPTFALPKHPSASTTVGKRMVMVGVHAEGNDWESVKLLARPRDDWLLTIITRRMDHVPEDIRSDPRTFRINFMENAPTPVMMKAIRDADVVVVPKLGTYLFQCFSGSIGLGLSMGRPIVMPHLMAVECFGPDYGTTYGGVVVGYDYPDGVLDKHPVGSGCTWPVPDEAIARVKACPRVGRTIVDAVSEAHMTTSPASVLAVAQREFDALTDRLDSFLLQRAAGGKHTLLSPLPPVARIAIIHSMPFHHEMMTCYVEFMQRTAGGEHTIIMGKDAGDWDAWLSVFEASLGAPLKLTVVRFGDDAKDAITDLYPKFDVWFATTDDDPFVSLLPRKNNLVVFDHAPHDRSGAPYRLAMRHFNPPDPRVCGVFLCVASFFDTLVAKHEHRRFHQAETTRVVIVGMGELRNDWKSVEELAAHEDVMVTLICRDPTLPHRCMPPDVLRRIVFLCNPPTGIMLETILESDVLVFPKFSSYIHHAMSGSVPMALSLGVPVVMPHAMATSCFGVHYEETSHRSIVGYTLPPDAPLDNVDTTVAYPEPQGDTMVKEEDRAWTIEPTSYDIIEAVKRASSTPRDDVRRFRDAWVETNMSLFMRTMNDILSKRRRPLLHAEMNMEALD